MKRLLLPLSILAVVGMLWGSATPAQACSCFGPAAIDEVDLLAVGVVVSIADDDEIREAGFEGVDDTDAVLSVERYLKGRGPNRILVNDPLPGGGCGIFDENSLGQRYLLYLLLEDSEYRTNICLGTIGLDDQYDGPFGQERLSDLESTLGVGVSPVSDTTFPYLPAVFAATLGPLAFLAGAAFVWRRGEPHN